MNKSTKVCIKEKLMGQGKSYEMIQRIIEDDDFDTSKYIIVLPYLSECHRYAGTESVGASQQPRKERGEVVYTCGGCSAGGRMFKHPSSFGDSGKLGSLERLIQKGDDIVTTHATLKNFSKDTLNYIQDTPYTLVIDEELECIKQYRGFTETRRDMLFGKYVEVEATGRLLWVGGDIDTPKSDWVTEIKNLCESGSLFQVEGTVFMWEYPVEFLKSFDNIIVLSYMVYGSMFWAYLKHHNIDFEMQREPRPELDWKHLIQITDNERMNKVGDGYYALSSNFFKNRMKGDPRNDYVFSQLQRNTYNFFNNTCKTPSRLNMWATLGDARKFMSGRGYTKGHVPVNCKATNEYIEKCSLAYLYNVFMSPKEEQYVSKWNDKPIEDIISLGTLLQWIFRSRLRVGEPIQVYIPSSRMRGLLERWIDDEYFYLRQ